MEANSSYAELHDDIGRFLKGPYSVKQKPSGWRQAKITGMEGVERKLGSRAMFRRALIKGWTSQASSSQELVSSETMRQIQRLDSSLKSIEQQLELHKEAINRLCNELEERPIVKHTQLFDIDSDFHVIQPIPVVIEEFKEEVIARFPEVEVYGVGKNEPQAITNLKKEIGRLFCDLRETPTDQLGKLPLSWLRVLERLLEKVGNT